MVAIPTPSLPALRLLPRPLAALALLAAAGASAQTPLSDPIPATIEKGKLQVAAVPFVRAPASEDVAGARGANGAYARIQYLLPVPGPGSRLAFNDTRGILYLTDASGATPQVYLDLRTRGLGFTNANFANESGFMGFAFHPEFATAGAPGYGKLYTAFSAEPEGAANYAGEGAIQHSVLQEWTAADAAADAFAGETRELLRVGQFAPNHNVGTIAFNPTAAAGAADYGLLYICFGDGGAANDPADNGQRLATPLGAIARIDPLATDAGSYGIPPDNPFVNRAGAAPEIWAYGLRHPQQFSWDAADGRMFIGDIGQNQIEEINLGVGGANYGWRLREGTFATGMAAGRRLGPVYRRPEADPMPLAYPVAQYDHDEGYAVGGGFVYRGERIPALLGKYLFTDFPRGRLFAIDGGGLTPGQPAAIEEVRLSFEGEERPFSAVAGFPNDYRPPGELRVDARLGIDHKGELYLLAKGDGWIRRLAPLSEPEVPGEPPVLLRPLPALELSASGGALTLDVSPFFSDPDNAADGALTFAAHSSNPAAATVAVTYGVLTLTPNPARTEGEATITVRATDADGLSTQATFMLTVTAMQADEAELLLGLSLNENATLAPIWHQAAEFAKADVNSAGGNVRFIDGDLDEDYFNPAKDPVVHLHELADLGVKGLIGPIASAAAISILDSLTSSRLVAISPVANADLITDLNAARPPSERYFFRTAPHNSLHAKILEDLTRADGDNVLVVHRDDDYGRDLASHIAAEMARDDRPPPITVAYQSFRVGIDPDADRKAEDFVRRSIDTLPEIGDVNSIIVVGFPAEGKVIAYLLRSQLVPEDANYYVSVGLAFNDLYRFVHSEDEDLNNPQTKAMAQARIKGFKGVAPFPHSHVPGCSWERRFPGIDLQRTLYSTHVYDAVVIMALASLKAGSTDPSVFRGEVAGVTRGGAKCASYAECRALLKANSSADIDYDGLSGPLELNEFGDLTDGLFTIYTYDGKGGSTHIVEEISPAGIRTLPNHCERPDLAQAFPPLQLLALGEALTLDLSLFFADADDLAGQSLTYAASSSDPALATVAVADGQLTVTANDDAAEGEAVLTIRATDATGLSVEATVAVTVFSGRSRLRPWWLHVLSDAE